MLTMLEHIQCRSATASLSTPRCCAQLLCKFILIGVTVHKEVSIEQKGEVCAGNGCKAMQDQTNGSDEYILNSQVSELLTM